MKILIKIITFLLLPFLSISQTIIIDEDFESYPTPPTVIGGCDKVNRIEIADMGGLWGSFEGTASYVANTEINCTNIGGAAEEFEDGRGLMIRYDGNNRGEGVFLEVPSEGIKKNTCYELTFDFSFLSNEAINSSVTDLALRIAVDDGNVDQQDVNSNCVGFLSTGAQYTTLEDFILGDFGTTTGGSMQTADEFYTVTHYFNVSNDYTQLLFLGLDKIDPTPVGRDFWILLDNIKLTQHCNPNPVTLSNPGLIDESFYQGSSITVTSPSFLSETNSLSTTEFEATNFIEILPSVEHDIASFRTSEYFEARVEYCSDPPDCPAQSLSRFDKGVNEKYDQDVEVKTRQSLTIDTEFNLSPNPVTDYILISNEAINDYQISIFNSSGLRVLSEKSESNKKSIDLSGLFPGMYFVRIYDSNGLIHLDKIIKR